MASLYYIINIDRYGAKPTYHAQICTQNTNRSECTLHRTKVYLTKISAIRAAQRWHKENAPHTALKPGFVIG